MSKFTLDVDLFVTRYIVPSTLLINYFAYYLVSLYWILNCVLESNMATMVRSDWLMRLDFSDVIHTSEKYVLRQMKIIEENCSYQHDMPILLHLNK